jgi:hypothetical protein
MAMTYLEKLVAAFSNVMKPLADSLASAESFASLLAHLGWKLNTTPDMNVIQSIFADITSRIDKLSQDAAASKGLPELVADVRQLFAALGAAKNINFSVLPEPLNQQAFWQAFPGDLVEYLLFKYLEEYHPSVFGISAFIGVLKEIQKEEDGAIGRLAYKRLTVDFSLIAKAVASPQDLFNKEYGWASQLKTGPLIFSLASLLKGFKAASQLYPVNEGFRNLYFDPSNPSLENLKQLVISPFQLISSNDNSISYVKPVLVILPIAPQNDLSAAPNGLLLLPYITGGAEKTINLEPGVDLTLTGGFEADLTRIHIYPDEVYVKLSSPNTELQASGRVDIKLTPAKILTGDAVSSHIELSEAHLSLGVLGTLKDIEVIIESAADSAALVINLGEGDGFLNKIFGDSPQVIDLATYIRWSSRHGLTFGGSSGLEISLPLHQSIGGLINLENFLIRLKPEDQPGNQPRPVLIQLAVSGGVTLGPLIGTVNQVGVEAWLSFPQNGGNLGPADLSIGFKPPNGIGLAVNAGPVKGGGYLYFDQEKEEYAGALELVFSNFLTLKAIGLITTRMPDGSKGFSLLIIITAEFETGIQLGFGFKLTGVGGLLGLNRTMRLQPLMEGVRTGAINGILFPRDVVANAPRIISDLRTIFPPEEGKFLIGPMAKLAWGTPTLITLSLGIIIEIPGNIAILGVLRAVLPTEEKSVIVLQVSFAGAIEFDKKRVYFFASLFESRVLYMTLEGEMGTLVAFGDDANFVLTVGGFHPRFNPPPLPFPSPVRVSLNVLNEPKARIRVMGYFGITSNTAQFGAHAELFFSFDAFSFKGHVGFDVLIQFSPFYFIAEVSASVSLDVFGLGAFSLRLHFSLEGPTPWRARGTGSISLLGAPFSADFDITWGETRDTTLPPIAVVPLLKAELEKTENWRVLPPASSNLLVALRNQEETGNALVLHPLGGLCVSQKAVPLDLTIDRVGNQKTSDAKYFSLEVAGGDLSKKDDLFEQFAIAQYQSMDDASKLSKPAFQRMHGGIELSIAAGQLNSSKVVRRTVRYEQVIIDENYKGSVQHFTEFVGNLFRHFLKGASVSQSLLSQHYRQQLVPFADKIKVNEEVFTVARQSNNQAFNKESTFTSQAMAYEYMNQTIANDPSQADVLHVIPQSEVVG